MIGLQFSENVSTVWTEIVQEFKQITSIVGKRLQSNLEENWIDMTVQFMQCNDEKNLI